MSRLSSRWESNPHARRHWFLKPTCLPFHHLRLFCFSYRLFDSTIAGGFASVNSFSTTRSSFLIRFSRFIGFHQVLFLFLSSHVDAHCLYQHHRVLFPTNSPILFWDGYPVGFYASFYFFRKVSSSSNNG